MFKINDIEYSTKEEALKNFIKYNDRIFFNCEKCGKEHSVEKRRFDGFYCSLCKRKINSLKKYGVESPSQAKETKEKKKQTNLQKYGGVAPACSKNVVDKMKQTNLQKYGGSMPLQNDEVKEKYKKTCIEKYGVNNVAKAKEVIEKKKQTSIKKYGIEYYITLKEIKEKIKQTNLKKYGVENPLYNKNIQEKIKQTNLKKYGAETPYANKEVQNKIRKTHLERYGNICSLANNEIHKKTISTLLEKYGVDNISKSKDFRFILNQGKKEYNYNKIKQRLSDNFEVLTSLEEYLIQNHKELPIRLKCKNCNKEFDFFVIDGDFPRCPFCSGSPEGGSFEEDDLANYISSIYKGTIERNKRNYLDNLYEIDIFLPELNIGFEYDGIQWHTENFGGKDRNYHLKKQEFAASKGIQLFFIRSNEWLEKKEIVKSIIASKLNYNIQKIYARKCEIKEINNKQSNDFLNDNHIQGEAVASIRIGLFYKIELVSIITLSKTRFNKKYEYELIRFANKKNVSVVGGFNKMISFFIKNYKPLSILTYSDKRLFNKNTYEKANFVQIGTSKPNYFYTKNGYISGSRIMYQKYKLKNKLNIFNENLSEYENMLQNGYDRIWDCGNRIFALIVN